MSEAEMAEEEIAQLKRIRENCIKALAIVTGASEEAIAIEPFKHAYSRQREIEQLQHELDERTGLANVKMWDQKEEIERLRPENEQLRAQVTHLVEAITHWQARWTALNEECQRWRDRWKEHDDENKRVWAENDRLKAERAGDQQRLFHYEKEIAALKAEVRHQIDLTLEERKLVKALREELDTVRAVAERLGKEYASLHDIVESMRLETLRD